MNAEPSASPTLPKCTGRGATESGISAASPSPHAPQEGSGEGPTFLPYGGTPQPAGQPLLLSAFGVYASFLLLVLGIILRLASFLTFRSMWTDEALLALNITRRSFRQLLGPLDWYQVAPVAFLWIERLAFRILGNADWVLRLLPLAASLAGLWLFRAIARRKLSNQGMLIGLALFALCSPLVYYAAEIKQYGCDATITLLLLWAALHWIEQPRPDRYGILAATGAIGLWCSQPAVFILGGLGLTMLMELRRRKWQGLGMAIGLFTCWFASFLGVYLVSLRPIVNQNYLHDFWAGGFAPSPVSLNGIKWYPAAFFGMFSSTLGLPFAGFAAALAAVGCWSLYRRDRSLLAMLAMPLVLALVTSALKRYPFQERLLLFAAPLLILLIAAGFAAVVGIAKGPRIASVPVLPALLALCVLAFPLRDGAYWLWAFPHQQIDWPRREEIKPILAYLQHHYLPGDRVYVYKYGGAPIAYYTAHYGLSDLNINYLPDVGPDDARIQASLATMKGARVWIILDHVYHFNQRQDLQMQYLDNLKKLARKLPDADFSSQGACILLFDFTTKIRS